MSGIVGWVDYNKDLRGKENVIQDMIAALQSRGGSESARYVSESALLCGRGDEPITLTCGGETYVLVADCRLTDTERLQSELGCAGQKLCQKSLLLRAYAERGESCLDYIEGSFAFAIWRQKAGILFLARDRMGVRPLFCRRTRSGVIFASEIKALFRHPQCPAHLDAEGFKQIFLLGPGRISGSGVYRNIQELEPAQCLTLDRDGFKKRHYWSLRACEYNLSEAAAAEAARELITAAVLKQLDDGTPCGAMLSGGLDSSIVTAIAARKYAACGLRMPTYSVDYEGNTRNFVKSKFQHTHDGEYIDIMSNAAGTAHKNITLDNREVAHSLKAAAEARDLPGMGDVDSSLLLFCREISKTVPAVLTGECADEIFGGYPWFFDPQLLHGEGFPWMCSMEIRARLLGMRDISVARDYADALARRTIKSADTLSGEDANDRRMRQMFLLSYKWFMQTLIDRADRMRGPLDIRVPFCDRALVEFAYNLPWKLKALGGREKGIMRAAFADMLPSDITERKKTPYPKTFDPWYANYVKKEAAHAVASSPILQQLIDTDYFSGLLSSSDPNSVDPWYGQLMRLPQLCAFLIQTAHLFEEYKVKPV